MARILINEPHPKVRQLLARMVERLGHEALTRQQVVPGYLEGVDLLIVEPAAPLGAVIAKATQILDPSLPIVCASVEAPPQIDVRFSSTLIKPFALAELGEAIEQALGENDAYPSAA
jgi:CheY-like chemotaxis protein